MRETFAQAEVARAITMGYGGRALRHCPDCGEWCLLGQTVCAACWSTFCYGGDIKLAQELKQESFDLADRLVDSSDEHKDLVHLAKRALYHNFRTSTVYAEYKERQGPA